MFLLDASVLITAKNGFYRLNRVPEFWEWLAHHGLSGELKMPIETFEEVSGGTDDLADWINAPEHANALKLEGDADVGLVQQVLQRYAPDLNDAETIKIGQDPFLIAHGLADRTTRCVVTAEPSKPSCQRANRRVPDVCNDLGVPWCGIVDLLDRLDFSTGWRGGNGGLSH